MKNKLLLTLLLTSTYLFSQNVQSDGSFKPGELIVKFKDEIDLSIKYNRQGLGKIGVDINEILSISSTVDSSYVMFNEKSVKQSIARKEDQEMRFKIRTSSVNGINNDTFLDDEPEIITFKNTLRLKFNSNPNIEELIKEIKQNPDIEYVEPNYLFSIND